MSTPNIRFYDVHARSAPVFGRVLCSSRNHHIVVDGPVQNGCPGEALTPPELFLNAVAACGVELMHVIARDLEVPLENVTIDLSAIVDRDNQARADVTLFNSVKLRVVLSGTDGERASELVEGFKRRCPLFGTVSVATPELVVEWSVAPGHASPPA